MKGEALMAADKPSPHLGMIVCDTVAEKSIVGPACGDMGIVGLQEVCAFLMLMAISFATDDGTLECVESGKQSGRGFYLHLTLSFLIDRLRGWVDVEVDRAH